MPIQSKIFRVFVSSTFSDMREERRILQQQVFPHLEKFCRENGARFQAVDLRWGVNAESQLNQNTMDICLKEIRRCQQISPKPNFILLLGDRYGWQPVPARIPVDEMKLIIKTGLPKEHQNLLERWYRRDDNAVPPEYVLLPRSREFTEYEEWQPVESEILTVLRDAVAQLGFGPDTRAKYFTSATHQEIISGALKPHDSIEDPKNHVFAYLRNIKGWPDDTCAGDFIDYCDDVPDLYSKQQLDELKAMLREKLPGNVYDYSAVWNNNNAELESSSDFAEKIVNDLKSVIETQLEEVITSDEIGQEKQIHQELKERLTSSFVGRSDTLATIDDYIQNAAKGQVYALFGASGSGKSSVMGKAVERASRSGIVVVFRFIGASARSSNLYSLLQSVTGEIAGEYGVSLESLVKEGQENSLVETRGMITAFENSLKLARPDKPMVLFFDSLDQMSNTDNALALKWLPRRLQNNVRVLVS